MRGDRVRVTWVAGGQVSSTTVIATRDGGRVRATRNEKAKTLEVEELGRNDNVVREATFDLEHVVATENWWEPFARLGKRKKST